MPQSLHLPNDSDRLPVTKENFASVVLRESVEGPHLRFCQLAPILIGQRDPLKAGTCEVKNFCKKLKKFQPTNQSEIHFETQR